MRESRTSGSVGAGEVDLPGLPDDFSSARVASAGRDGVGVMPPRYPRRDDDRRAPPPVEGAWFSRRDGAGRARLVSSRAVEPGPDGKVPGPGDVLSGKYVVERVIAAGGMGVVLAARHARLGHRVAIKVLHPYMRSVPEIAGRFEREARAAALIRSRNVARVLDVEALPDG
jgi:serine/threonine protein kinase